MTYMLLSDSEVDKVFSFGKTKCSYPVYYGSAVYFLGSLNTQLMELALFDKSSHKVEKEGHVAN